MTDLQRAIEKVREMRNKDGEAFNYRERRESVEYWRIRVNTANEIITELESLAASSEQAGSLSAASMKVLERVGTHGGMSPTDFACHLAGHTPREGHLQCLELAAEYQRALEEIRAFHNSEQEDSVSAALTELREMGEVAGYRQITITEGSGGNSAQVVFQKSIYSSLSQVFVGATLSEALDKVRKWKEEQKP